MLLIFYYWMSGKQSPAVNEHVSPPPFPGTQQSKSGFYSSHTQSRGAPSHLKTEQSCHVPMCKQLAVPQFSHNFLT